MSPKHHKYEWQKHVSRGRDARLFPSLKTSNKEQIATSILLAVFRLVPELLAELIKDVGVTITDKTIFCALTEVNLQNEKETKKDRPDGYLFIKKRNEWSALIEAKVAKKEMHTNQIISYLEAARANNIDAVITISNDFSPRVNQSPFEIPKKHLNKLKLYHFSWRLILSKAQLLKNDGEFTDREKLFVLSELIKFLRDDSVGEKSFNAMPSSWLELSKEFGIGAKIRSSDRRISEAASALVEEFSDIALILTDHLGVNCQVKLPTSFINDKSLWQKSIERSLAEGKPIGCEFSIPEAANLLLLEIDIRTNTFWIGMEICAPKDKKTVLGRVNWMRRQFKSVKIEEDAYMKIKWKFQSDGEVLRLSDFMDGLPSAPNKSASISSFTPLIRIQSTRVFQSKKKFIVELEKAVLNFYDNFGQYMKAWVPSAPPPLNNEADENS